MNILIYKIMSDIDKLAYDVVQLLRKNGNIQIATAESCTGGLLSGFITSVSGASDIFKLGICAYANSAKEELLSVRSETLLAYGAVSKQTAFEMARGIRKKTNSDIGVSTTGIAGPFGGTADKPTGSVHFACVTEKTERHLHIIIDASIIEENERRQYIRLEAVRQAFILIKDTAVQLNSDK